MPFNCDHWSLTIKIKRSYPRQHTLALKCIQFTEFFACKVIRDNTSLQSVTKVETRKKHLTLDLKHKKSLLCYDHFLTVQYLDGPSGGVERGALAALAVTGLLPEH